MNSPDHREKFEHARRTFQRGGASAPVCGARTRNGGTCSNPPLTDGNGRCLSHCGPKAANAYRRRQKRRFEAGQISAAEWNRAEARRAANRLGDAWKKNPWLEGRTIDLAEHEAGFLKALGGMEVDVLAPAVVDWLRWKYQRLQIDTRNDVAWMDVRLTKLPARIEKAGRRPAASDAKPSAYVGPSVPWRDPRQVGTRRNLPDQPRAKKTYEPSANLSVGRPRALPAGADEQDALLELYRAHADVLRPIMDVAIGEAGQWAVLRTLRAYLDAPQNPGAHQRWLALIAATMVPPMKSGRA